MEEQKHITLNDLLRELRKVTSNMTSGGIPLRINGKKVISVEPDVVTDDECHVIECNLKVELQSNLDRLKEIAEPAPTDWREVAEERRKNREQYHKDIHEWLEKKMSEEISNDIDDEILTSCWYNGHDRDSVEWKIKTTRDVLQQAKSDAYPGLDKMEYVESVDDAVRMGLTGKDLEKAKTFFDTCEKYNKVNDIYMALPKASGDEYRNMVKAYEDFEKELRKEKRDEPEMIITLIGRKSDHFPEMWCECEDFSIDFNFDDLPKYLKESYAEFNNAKHSRPPLSFGGEEEIIRLEAKFFGKCDEYLKSYFDTSFVHTEYYTIKF